MEKDKYMKFARSYPTISAMVIPAVVVSWMCIDIGQAPNSSWDFALKILTFAPISGLFVALGFWFTEVSRFISLLIMDRTRFNLVNAKLPTTFLLINKNSRLSDDLRKILSDKLRKNHCINLPTKGDESEEAVNLCIDITGIMREETRDNKILCQYNYEFGFCRNYIGASIISLIMLLLILVIALYYDYSIVGCVIGLIFQSALTFFFWKALCISGNLYASHLIYSYTSKK